MFFTSFIRLEYLLLLVQNLCHFLIGKFAKKTKEDVRSKERRQLDGIKWEKWKREQNREQN